MDSHIHTRTHTSHITHITHITLTHHTHNTSYTHTTHTHRYALLQRLSRERKQRLEESKKKFNLIREMNELEHWLSDKEALASAEESAKDLEHVEALKKKSDDFQKDVVANEARLDSINTMAQEMIDEGHFDAEEIQGLVEVGVSVT